MLVMDVSSAQLPPQDPLSPPSHPCPSVWMLPEEASPGAGQHEEADGCPPEGHERHRPPSSWTSPCVREPFPTHLTDTKTTFQCNKCLWKPFSLDKPSSVENSFTELRHCLGDQSQLLLQLFPLGPNLPLLLIGMRQPK